MNNTAQAVTEPRPSPLFMDWWEPETLASESNEAAISALNAVKKRHADGMPFLRLPETTDDLAEIQSLADKVIAQSDTLVLVGIGGSSLGAEAVTSLRPATHSLKLEVMDNPDPDSFAAFQATLDPAKTSWVFISKSGGTLETVSQTMIVLKWLEDAIGKAGITERCIAITEPKDSSLTKLANHYDIPTYEHDPELGGRWTCLSRVGLIAAAACGVNIRDMRAGANAILQHTLTTDIAANQPLQGALYGVRNAKAGRSTHTIMPYADTLYFTASWCRQLISESLGKNGKGITPLAALGSVDQHSMLQLLLDGPNDKYFTIIVTGQDGRGAEVPADLADIAGLGYLGGKPLGNVISAFQQGTIGSFQEYKRPVRTINLPTIDAFHLGALLMYFMLETVLISELIGVDAFDQPAVEDGKIRAKAILGA